MEIAPVPARFVVRVSDPEPSTTCVEFVRPFWVRCGEHGSEDQHRELLRPMSAKDENALDVPGAARAGHQRNHAREVRLILLFHQRQCRGQISNQLIAPRQNYVMRWQH